MVLFSAEALMDGWAFFLVKKTSLYGFWLDSCVVNSDISFRNRLIYEGKPCFSSSSMTRTASEYIMYR